MDTAGRTAIVLAALLALSGCARDVVIKPAVIAFNADAHASVNAARRQYDETIARLNRQTADFIARNPDCGLALQITPRRRNTTSPQTGPYCLTEAEKTEISGNIVTETLPIATRDTFAVQFRAIDLLLDYTAFLASRADDPELTASADIIATAGAIKGLGAGVADLKLALVRDSMPLKEFKAGGAVDQFAGAIGDLAEQIELIARQADDVAALERAIKASQQPVGAAIDRLASSADAWSCAALERRQIDANAYALAWTPRLAALDIAARREIAANWLNQVQVVIPAYCPGDRSAGTPVIRSQVAEMLVALRAANDALVDIANHDYTPAQRQAIAQATLSRLGTLLSRLAAAVPLLP